MKIMVVAERKNVKTEKLFRENGHDVVFRYSEIFLQNEFDEDGGGFDMMIAYPRTEFLDKRVKESMGFFKNGLQTAWNRLSNLGKSHESEILNKRMRDLWFFSYLWDENIPKICIVSQRIPKWDSNVWDVKPAQKIPARLLNGNKVGSTYLWLKGLPKLKMVGDIEQAMVEQWMGGVKW